MKKIVVPVILSLFIILSLLLSNEGPKPSGEEEKTRPADDEIIGQVLQAHNVLLHPEWLSSYRVQVVRITSFFDGKERNSFERDISIEVQADMFKRHRTDSEHIRETEEVFDGQTLRQTVKEKGRPVEVNRIMGSQQKEIVLSAKTFCLIPVLKLLSNPETKITYLGQTPRKYDEFQVETSTGNWIIQCDQSHLIRKLITGKQSVEFAGYRFVDGIWLPLIQRIFIGTQVDYEMFFTKIEVNSTFPSGYFAHKA